MPIIHSIITPHSPLLIPSIGKESNKLLEKTINAIKKIEEEFYSTQIETLLIISSHSQRDDDTFSVSMSEEFEINFKEFGDFGNKKLLKGDTLLTHQIKKEIFGENKIRLINKKELNHGAGIPLYLLTENIKDVKIIPFYCSEASLNEHFLIGEKIQKALMKSNKRVGIIASGDLSHKLTPNAPAGFSPKAIKFDQRIVEYLQNKKNQNLIEISPDLIEEVETEGLKSISLLMGTLNNLNYSPKLFSYEHPFGVGYLTMSFYL
ncbi:AmmeMemoRadiSam system protein B [bacterium]|nr:AmmeMemoRadiSam system protein B [bacterium]